MEGEEHKCIQKKRLDNIEKKIDKNWEDFWKSFEKRDERMYAAFEKNQEKLDELAETKADKTDLKDTQGKYDKLFYLLVAFFILFMIKTFVWGY